MIGRWWPVRVAPYFVHCVPDTIYCSESHILLISVLKWFDVDALNNLAV